MVKRYSRGHDGMQENILGDWVTFADHKEALRQAVAAEELQWIKGVHKALDEHDDPTPWCSGCGAMRKTDCKCGELASND